MTFSLSIDCNNGGLHVQCILQNNKIKQYVHTWTSGLRQCPVFTATFKYLWGNVSMTTKCGQTSLGYLRLDLRLIWSMAKCEQTLIYCTPIKVIKVYRTAMSDIKTFLSITN